MSVYFSVVFYILEKSDRPELENLIINLESDTQSLINLHLIKEQTTSSFLFRIEISIFHYVIRFY